MNISVSIVAQLTVRLFAILFGNFVWVKAVLIGLYSMVIPATQEKLIRKLMSNADRGLNKNMIIPARAIEDKGSYSL